MENCSEKTFGGVTIVERSDWTCGVVDSTGEIVVPFGKYEEIDGFDHGLARVRTEGVILCGSNGKVETNPTKLKAAIKKDGDIYAKWGIINQKGEFCKEVYLHELNLKLPVRMSKEDYVYSVDEEMDYGFSIDECFDYEGNFDGQRLDDAIMDGLYVPEDW